VNVVIAGIGLERSVAPQDAATRKVASNHTSLREGTKAGVASPAAGLTGT
jgi:hypothetical protein